MSENTMRGIADTGSPTDRDMRTKDGGGWYWDESQAVVAEGAEAQKVMNRLLMQATHTDTVEEANRVLLGRPRAGQSVPTTKLQVRVPETWTERIDQIAGAHGESRSAWLRDLIAAGLQMA